MPDQEMTLVYGGLVNYYTIAAQYALYGEEVDWEDYDLDIITATMKNDRRKMRELPCYLQSKKRIRNLLSEGIRNAK